MQTTVLGDPEGQVRMWDQDVQKLFGVIREEADGADAKPILKRLVNTGL